MSLELIMRYGSRTMMVNELGQEWEAEPGLILNVGGSSYFLSKRKFPVISQTEDSITVRDNDFPDRTYVFNTNMIYIQEIAEGPGGLCLRF